MHKWRLYDKGPPSKDPYAKVCQTVHVLRPKRAPANYRRPVLLRRRRPIGTAQQAVLMILQLLVFLMLLLVLFLLLL